jgi:hypothetical protein
MFVGRRRGGRAEHFRYRVREARLQEIGLLRAPARYDVDPESHADTKHKWQCDEIPEIERYVERDAWSQLVIKYRSGLCGAPINTGAIRMNLSRVMALVISSVKVRIDKAL